MEHILTEGDNTDFVASKESGQNSDERQLDALAATFDLSDLDEEYRQTWIGKVRVGSRW